MKRILPLACMMLLCALPLVAEDTKSDNQDDKQNQTEEIVYQMNQPGDQYISVALNGVFPLNFGNLFTGDSKLSIGGMGTLGYHYFFTNSFIAGIDVGFGFNVTIGSHVFNYIPILATATYQPTLGKFEFPMTLGVGMAMETYIGYKYFPALVVKPEVGVYYRLTPSWSIGLDASYLFLPQFAQLYDSSAHNIFGHFATAGLAARYHF